MKLFFEYKLTPLVLQLRDEAGVLQHSVPDAEGETMFERAVKWAVEHGYEGPYVLMAGQSKEEAR